MFGRGWITHPAIGVALFAVLGLPPIHVQRGDHAPSQGANNASAQQEADAFEEAILEIAVEDTTASEQNANANPDSELRRKDALEAASSASQVAMAAAAFLTLILLWRTIFLTRKLLKEAQDTSQAARDTVEVTREIGEAQVRAYLGFAVIAGDVVAGKPLNFTVKISNHGQSPARDVAVASSAFVRAREWQWGDKPETEPTGKASLVTIHPGGELTVNPDMDPPINLEDDTIQNLKSESASVFASVLVRYKDVFDKKWETQFCFEFSGEHCFRTGKVRMSPRGNYDKPAPPGGD